METDSHAAGPGGSFAVEYQTFSGGANPDLQGRGQFTIGTGEPRFHFTGKTRAMFGRTTTLPFRSDQIWNTTVEGPKVQFQTRVGKAGAKGVPFVFFCATPEEAAQVAQRLPQAKDGEYAAAVNFAGKLSLLPGASSPWTSVTNLLIAANFAVFVAMGFLGAGWFEAAAMRPYVLYVANNAGATTDGEWWRIVTCMFVHYGAIHLLLNMWALFQTGHFVEKLLGRPLFALAYFGSGIVASFTTLFWNADKVWSAGASGAVFGVYGMLLGFMLREKQAIPKSVFQPMLKSTLTFAGYNLFFGMVHPQIDNAGHIGGLIGGLALGWLVALPVDLEIRARLGSARLRLGLGAVALAAAGGAIFAPRFDYRFREELNWAEAIKGPVAKEPELLQRQQALTADFQQGKEGGGLIRLLETEAIPFYEKWRDQLDAMVLTPGKLTDQRRKTLATLVRTKIVNYRQLSAGLREKDARAIENYAAAESRALDHAQGPKK
jgi:rhomboid protease GluP